jgi:hypothetical protein
MRHRARSASSCERGLGATPSGAGPGEVAGRGGPGPGAASPPDYRDGPEGADRAADVNTDLQRRHRHDDRQQQTGAQSPRTPKAVTAEPLEPTDAPTPPRSHQPSSPLHLPTSRVAFAAAPPPATQASRMGWPVQVVTWTVEEGESGGFPFLPSPGGKPRKHPKAGRRPVALSGETHNAGSQLIGHCAESQGSGQAARLFRLLGLLGLVKAGCSRDATSPPKAYATPQC